LETQSKQLFCLSSLLLAGAVGVALVLAAEVVRVDIGKTQILKLYLVKVTQ
jgi:hypothetical protein